jgi:hypothetical protein
MSHPYNNVYGYRERRKNPAFRSADGYLYFCVLLRPGGSGDTNRIVQGGFERGERTGNPFRF